MHHYFQTCNQNCFLILTNALATAPEVVNAQFVSPPVFLVIWIKYVNLLMQKTVIFAVVVIVAVAPTIEVPAPPTVVGVTLVHALILVMYLRLMPSAYVICILGL